MIHAEQLDAIPHGRLGSLGERVRAAGLRVRPILASAPALPEGMRRPGLALRLAGEPLARLFFLHDVVSADACAEALGAELRDALLSDGLLTHVEGGIRSNVLLSPDEGTIVEHPPLLGAVGLAMSLVSGRVARALAFGGDLRACALSRVADEVVAFDPRPRTGALLRANAALAGTTIATPEQLGDGPFDLVAIDVRFDDPVERVALSRVESLAPGGILCAVVESLDRGLLEVLTPPEPLQLLALDLPAHPIEEACALRAAALHPELGEAYAHAFDSAIATWTARRISHVTRGVLVVRRAEPAFRVPRFAERESRIDRAFAACVTAHLPDAELLDASLAVPRGTRAREVDDGVALRPPHTQAAISLGPLHAEVLERVHAASSVRAALEGFAKARNASLDDVIAALLPAVREALRAGLLEVAS